jgi:hypothetical protein
MANTFVHTENTNKLILNVTNGTNNNAGFNLANFKPKFIRDYFEDVLADYERSFIGAFAAALCNKYLPSDQFQIYCSISKFVGNVGYSLVANKPYEIENVDLEI